MKDVEGLGLGLEVGGLYRVEQDHRLPTHRAYELVARIVCARVKPYLLGAGDNRLRGVGCSRVKSKELCWDDALRGGRVQSARGKV